LPTKTDNPRDFELLDTNKDGKIDWRDDPYSGYYPGDEYVDWVGISIYWVPNDHTGFNVLPYDNFFHDCLVGRGSTIKKIFPEVDGLLNRNFYKNFAFDKNKPMMISETGAPFYTNHAVNATAADIVGNWYTQIFTNLDSFPLIKNFNQFEERKAPNDWRVSQTFESLDVFKRIVASWRDRLSFATDFSINCGGYYVAK
jgi:hypothetical protein